MLGRASDRLEQDERRSCLLSSRLSEETDEHQRVCMHQGRRRASARGQWAVHFCVLQKSAVRSRALGVLGVFLYLVSCILYPCVDGDEAGETGGV